MNAEIVPVVQQLARRDEDLALSPIFDVATAQNRLAELQRFVKFYLVEGEDFGTIPGTPKPTLYKPGADKLCDIYALADTYRITNRVEDWTRNLFDYEIECTLSSKRTGAIASTGVGSCNSYEGRYRWRETKRTCPKCRKPTIIKGQAQYGGGFVCWKKADGCGAKFNDDDKTITSQEVGKVENDDMPTLKNTLLKMAKKRAKVDAVLSATRSSGLFTQDVEDWVIPVQDGGSVEAQQTVAEKKIAELQQKKAAKPAPPAQDLTQKLQESIAATQKPSGHADPFNDGPLDSRPLITKAEMGKKGGKADGMLFIEYDGEKATVFDKSWFPYMKKGVPADLELHTSKKDGKTYTNVTKVFSVGDTKAGPDGKPALDVNRPAGAAFDQQVEDISADYDPFQEAEAGLL